MEFSTLVYSLTPRFHFILKLHHILYFYEHLKLIINVVHNSILMTFWNLETPRLFDSKIYHLGCWLASVPAFVRQSLLSPQWRQSK